MICIDSSVVAKLFLREVQTDHARALYYGTVAAGLPVVAPSLLLFELTNIVRQQMRRGGVLPVDDANALLAAFLALPIELHAPAGLHQIALNLAATYNLSASYDAHYLALAQILDCEFWTGDLRLVNQVAQALPFVRWLGDFVTS